MLSPSRMRPVHTSLFFLIFTAMSLFSTQAMAGAPIRQAGNFGLGIGGGYGVTGLSMKYFMAGDQALQGTVGFDWRNDRGRGNFDGDYIGLTLDYLLELPFFLEHEVINIGPSVGVGGFAGLWDNGVALGISGVAGLEFMLNPIPIEFVIEYRPSLRVVPNVDFDLVGFTGHARFYF